MEARFSIKEWGVLQTAIRALSVSAEEGDITRLTANESRVLLQCIPLAISRSVLSGEIYKALNKRVELK